MSKTITFSSLPQNCAELKALPQAKLTDPFEVAALVVAVLCRYEQSVDDCSQNRNKKAKNTDPVQRTAVFTHQANADYPSYGQKDEKHLLHGRDLIQNRYCGKDTGNRDDGDHHS